MNQYNQYLLSNVSINPLYIYADVMHINFSCHNNKIKKKKKHFTTGTPNISSQPLPGKPFPLSLC